MTLRLHGYWRSGAAWRVRIALALKGLEYDTVTHDLRIGAHREPDYAALNPQRLVPALETDDGALTQSPAILEWLEEVHPAPPLLPADTRGRAIVRGMAALIGCDVHPINNLRVLNALREDMHADEAAVSGWITRWITDGFAALETLVARHGDGFAYGDTPTLADCYLLPQIYSARRFAVDLTPFPGIVAAGDRLAALPAVAPTCPDAQPDAS